MKRKQVELNTDLSFSSRRPSIIPWYFFVTTKRLILRDYAQETNFVLNTFIVFTDGVH